MGIGNYGGAVSRRQLPQISAIGDRVGTGFWFDGKRDSFQISAKANPDLASGLVEFNGSGYSIYKDDGPAGSISYADGVAGKPTPGIRLQFPQGTDQGPMAYFNLRPTGSDNSVQWTIGIVFTTTGLPVGMDFAEFETKKFDARFVVNHDNKVNAGIRMDKEGDNYFFGHNGGGGDPATTGGTFLAVLTHSDVGNGFNMRNVDLQTMVMTDDTALSMKYPNLPAYYNQNDAEYEDSVWGTFRVGHDGSAYTADADVDFVLNEAFFLDQWCGADTTLQLAREMRRKWVQVV